jgi:beta-glucoside operon transcriptional antiterminator
MRAIKKINNNVVICVDGSGKELIAFGKGVGFPSMPYEIKDLSLISMTFYRVDNRFYNLIGEI